mgnify:CR=1 FL=1
MSPTGSGSAAISSRLLAIPSIRESSSSSRSSIAPEISFFFAVDISSLLAALMIAYFGLGPRNLEVNGEGGGETGPHVVDNVNDDIVNNVSPIIGMAAG